MTMNEYCFSTAPTRESEKLSTYAFHSVLFANQSSRAADTKHWNCRRYGPHCPFLTLQT